MKLSDAIEARLADNASSTGQPPTDNDRLRRTLLTAARALDVADAALRDVVALLDEADPAPVAEAVANDDPSLCQHPDDYLQTIAGMTGVPQVLCNACGTNLG